MIVRSKANELLELLVHNSATGSSRVYYYIGLSTTTPTATGGNFTEPAIPEGAVDDEGQAITVNEYQRVSLEDVIGTAANAIIKNSGIIFFNEAEHYGWGTITHFGIFTSKDKNVARTPIFFGEVKNSDGTVGVPVPKNHIPIFRANKLQIGLDQDPANPV